MAKIRLSLTGGDVDHITSVIDVQRNITDMKRIKAPSWVRDEQLRLMRTLSAQDQKYSKAKELGRETYWITTDMSEALAYAFYIFLRYSYENQRQIISWNDRGFVRRTYSLIKRILDHHEEQM